MSRSLGGLIGMLVGIALVRVFLFNTVEAAGWNMFWDSLLHSNSGYFADYSIRHLFERTSFWKAVIGGILGYWAGSRLAPRRG